MPKGIKSIEELEVLYVKGSTHSKIKDLGKLSRLKYLGLTGLTKKNRKKSLSYPAKALPFFDLLGACWKNGPLCFLPIDRIDPVPTPRDHKTGWPRCNNVRMNFSFIDTVRVKLYRTNPQQNNIRPLEEYTA